MSKQQPVQFKLSHLKGPAKDGMELLEASQISDPDENLHTLQEVFGKKQSPTQLFWLQFNDWRQWDIKSLWKYSHKLSELVRWMKWKDGGVMSNVDKLIICDENVQDQTLRKMLKRKIWQEPQICFLKLREEVLYLAREKINHI